MDARGDWVPQHLAEFLAAIAAFGEPDSAIQAAVERTAEALEAEVGAMVQAETVVASVGFPRGRVPVEVLVEATRQEHGATSIPGVGPCNVAVVAFDDEGPACLILARAGEGFGPEEVGLLRGMVRVLAQTLRTLRALDAQRERQALLERLFQIQRSISHRAPTQDILDAIVAGAAELLGDPVAVIRVHDDEDPGLVRTLSATGLPDPSMDAVRLGPMYDGIGARAMASGGLIVTGDEPGGPALAATLVALGLRAGMAAPVHREGKVVGSITVACPRAGRHYSSNEQEALLALAEHASLALNDASALQAMHEAFADAVHQASHDPLTGLPNRALALDRIGHALARGRRSSASVGILFVDLDRFKAINDSFGHVAGDEVLVRVSERLTDAVRDGDTVARLGGDEFVVVCEETDPMQTMRVAERVADAIAKPISLGGNEAVLSACIGVAFSGEQSRAEDLLIDADLAMYRAKERGRARIELFDKTMRERTVARLETERALRRAVAHGDLQLHYQPIVALDTGAAVACEALLRWEHPARGLIPPDEFISVAEDTGMIVPIGKWVLHEALSQLAIWRADEAACRDLQVSVNLCARQFADPGLVRIVAGALDRAEIEPGALWLEITESVLMDEAEATVETLRALKRLGVRIAVDDFGTGYSSLSYLKRFPVDELKIDRSFVDGLGHDSEDRAIVAAVIGLGRALGLGVLAEGVETEAQLAELRRLGCDSAQGYLFGRPQPPDQLPTSIRAGARPKTRV